MPRTKEIEQIRSRLRKDHFVSLSGPLGCGKSMVCQGLIQSLEVRKSAIRILPTAKSFFNAKAGLNWKTVYVRLNPTVNPYDQLAKKLSTPTNNVLLGPYEKVSPMFESQVKSLLRAPDNMGLVNIYKKFPYIQRYNFLIIIDQFENLLFTTQISQEEKRNFVQLLLNGSYMEQLVYSMISVRPPRNEKWKAEFGELRDAIEDCDFPLFHLDQKSLKLAIEKYFQEETVRYKRSKTPHWKKIRPEKLRLDAHESISREVYVDSNPLEAMKARLADGELKEKAEKTEISIKIKRIGGVSLDHKPKSEEEFVDPDEELDLMPHIEEPPQTAPLYEKAEFVYTGLTLPQKRVARKLFVLLAEEASADPMAEIEVGEIINTFGRFEETVIQIVEKFAFYGILTSENDGENPKAAKVRLTDVHLSTDWMKFGDWIAESGKRINLSGPTVGGGGMQERTFHTSPIAVEIPKESSALVDRAESTYLSLSIVLKRVCRKLFKALATVPDDENGNPGKARLGDLIDDIGKFKRQLLEVADTFVQQGVLRGPDDGDIHFDAQIAIPKVELYMFWARLREWAQDLREIPDKLEEKPAPQAEESASAQQVAPPVQEPAPLPDDDMDDFIDDFEDEYSTPVEPQVRSKPREREVVNPVAAPVAETAVSSHQDSGPSQRAEAAYNSLVLPHKRVAQRLLVALAQNNGNATLGDLVNQIGRFERQLGSIAGQLCAEGVLKAQPSGPVEMNTQLSFIESSLPESWPMLAKWIREA